MKPNKIYSLAILALGLVMLNSCSKKQEDQLTNLPVERKDDGQAQVIDYSSINNNMVLEDRVNGVDYIINKNVEVNANLTIKPGVTIMFADGAGLQVNEEGSLTAIGETSNQIYFTSQSGKRGAWKGITILSANNHNVLSMCKIEHGGADNSFGTADVIVGAANNTASAEISNCDITASSKDGVVVGEGSSIINFTGNHIFTNSAYPVSMHIGDAAMLDNSNNCSNNGKEFFHVSANGTVEKAITLKNLNEAFLVSGVITAANSFTINAGARIYMDNNAEVVIDGIEGNGYFNAIGTQSQPITISAIYNGTGVWNSIKFRSSNSNNNHIEYCTISGGGMTNQGWEGMVSVVNDNGGSSNIVIRHSSIMNSAATGIYIQSANSEYNSDITSSNTFTNCAKGDIHFE